MRIANCKASGKQIHLCQCKVCYLDWIRIKKTLEDFEKSIKKGEVKKEKINF